MTNSKYAAFVALDPFFDIVMQGLAGAVDGDHYFEAVADDAVFEFRYVFPGFPTKVVGRDALMALYSGYGDIAAWCPISMPIPEAENPPSVAGNPYSVLTYSRNASIPSSACLVGRISSGAYCFGSSASVIYIMRLKR